MRRINIVPFHPVLFALTIVFALYLDADVSLHAVVRTFVLVVLAAALLTVGAVAAFGRVVGPIVVTSAILIVRSADPNHAAIAIVLGALLALVLTLARRYLSVFSVLREPNRLLNVVSVALLMATLVVGVVSGTVGRIDLAQGRPFSDAVAAEVPGDQSRPDVYLILLDGYPRADTLQRIFAFDNSPFLEALDARGFEVAEQSRSNYMYTAMSLTSVLHMSYVQEIAGTAGPEAPNGASLHVLINHNPVWDRLRSMGYQVAANQSPWETVGMRGANLFCGNQINDFELYLIRTTLLGALVDAVNPAFQGDQHRDVVNQAFDCLAELSAPTASPKAVFIHVGAPHLPVVFDRSGGAASRDVFGYNARELAVSAAEFDAAYVQEIEYLNARILEAVDRLAERQDHPVVIIWSDHGSESHLDWADSSKSDLAERFSNFFAARTPGKPSVFPPDLTPINLFPILFNAYFEAGIPRVDARFFLSPIENRLEFTEIPDPAPPAVREPL